MSPIFRIFSFTRNFWKWYLFMAFFVIVISLLSLATPLLSKQVVDIIVAKFNGQDIAFSRLYLILAAIIFIDLTSSLITSFGQWIGDILAIRLQSHLSSNFYKHLLSLHIGYFDNEITGKIINKMYRGITSISDFIQDAFNNFLPFFLTAIVTILLLAHYSLVISFLLFILFPLYIFISQKSSNAWGKYEEKKNGLNDFSQGRVFETLTGIRVVKSFATEAAELKSFIFNRHQIEGLTIDQSRGWHLFDLLRRSMLNIILFSIYAYVVYYTYLGQYTLGEMTLLIQLVNQARWPLFAMSFIIGQIQQASAGSQDFFKVLSTTSEIKDIPLATNLTLKKISSPLINFDHLTFGYSASSPVLKNISFSLNAGQRLALVAESGQGKSTIVNLLLRYYQPQSGKIFINQQDISSVSQTSLRQNMAVVFQESLLFSGTIRENIFYGNPKASKSEIIAAAQAANAHDFITKLPDGYQSKVGERGVKLSGGQKQRIAIARAILKDAPIVILDEATSSLDSRSELHVQKGLDRLMKNKTTIVIAHRLSTIANADLILAIENGHITQFGSPTELLKNKSGLYAKLIGLQQQLLAAPSSPELNQELKQFDLVG